MDAMTKNYRETQLQKITDYQHLTVKVTDFLGHNTFYMGITEGEYKQIRAILLGQPVKNEATTVKLEGRF